MVEDHAQCVDVGFNEALQRTTAVSGNVWNSTVELRLAASPTSEWAEPLPLAVGVAPPGWFIAGGVEHASLRSADQRTLAVTYHTTAADAPPGIHLVTVRLDGAAP